jgi:hypothetical protein
MPKNQRLKAIEDWVLIGFFLVALSAPVVKMKLRPESAQARTENRTLAPLPELSLRMTTLRQLPEKFGLYFNDHFGFRLTLIRWQAIAEVKWLRVSSSPTVILGKDGWLFFDSSNEEGLRSYRSEKPFTEEQLAGWGQELTARRDWLAQRGIRYLFVVAPDKQSIYPEYLPENLIRTPQSSRMDQLIAYVKERSNFAILDLRPTLLEQKGARPLYYKTDTHWNSVGGFVAYSAILRELAKSFSEMQPLKESASLEPKGTSHDGDLSRMLGMGGLLSEEMTEFTLRSQGYTLNSDSTGGFELFTSENKRRDLPKLIMFCDSFGNAIMPFLAQHFSRGVFAFKPQFDPIRVEVEHPNVVIEEIAERHLFDNPIPKRVDVGHTLEDRKSQ